MADTPVFLIFAENGEIRALTEAEYKQGFAYLGNMPPTVADFNYLLQQMDKKMVYLKELIDHPQTPQVLDYIKEQVSQASHIWVQSAADGKLHPMTLVDAKKAILDSDGEGLYLLEQRMRQTEMQLAEIALALEAQKIYPDYASMIIEDFVDVNTIDQFNVRVTSVIAGDDSLDLESLIGVLPGSVYMLSDGVQQELVTTKSIVKNGSVNRVVLAGMVQKTYNPANARLYRTTAQIFEGRVEGAGGQDARAWNAALTWTGTNANAPVTIPMPMTAANASDFAITGDVAFTEDGYVTLQ